MIEEIERELKLRLATAETEMRPMTELEPVTEVKDHEDDGPAAATNADFAQATAEDEDEREAEDNRIEKRPRAFTWCKYIRIQIWTFVEVVL